MARAGTDARRRAAILFAQGLSRAEVARAVGVSRATTTRWYRLFGSDGGRGLLAAAPRGRPPRLDARQLGEVEAALLGPPRAWGFDLDRCSLAAVAALVERLTGVQHHSRHAGRLMRRMGFVIPPVGGAADDTLRRKAILDPDGNVVGVFERGRPPARRRGRGA